MPKYEVKVCYEYRETRHEWYVVDAGDPEEAEEIAAEQFYEDYDTEIDGVTTKKIGDRY